MSISKLHKFEWFKKKREKKIREQNRKVMAQRNEMTVAKSFPYFYLLCARVVRFFLIARNDGRFV